MKTLRYRIGNAVKPGILDAEENICDACNSAKRKNFNIYKDLDWSDRKKEFYKLLAKINKV